MLSELSPAEAVALISALVFQVKGQRVACVCARGLGWSRVSGTQARWSVWWSVPGGVAAEAGPDTAPPPALCRRGKLACTKGCAHAGSPCSTFQGRWGTRPVVGQGGVANQTLASVGTHRT